MFETFLGGCERTTTRYPRLPLPLLFILCRAFLLVGLPISPLTFPLLSFRDLKTRFQTAMTIAEKTTRRLRGKFFLDRNLFFRYATRSVIAYMFVYLSRYQREGDFFFFALQQGL